MPGPASTTVPQKVWKVLCVIPHCSCQRRVSSLCELFVAMTVLGQSLPEWPIRAMPAVRRQRPLSGHRGTSQTCQQPPSLTHIN